MTPIQASIKSNENEIYNNIPDKREKRKPKFEIGDIVRTCNLHRTFYEGDNWSYALFTKKKL